MTRIEKTETPAVATAQGFQEQSTADTRFCAQHAADSKRIATVTARGALVGLVLQPLADGAWQVLSQFGQPATLQSLQAAEALVYGCELVRADAALLLRQIGGAA
jgi:hypothetical protein